MPDLPSGTVTFLFTDLEGSTRLWDEHPDAMRAALLQHDDLLPAGAALHALGEHRLKDLGRPENVFQLCHPDLPRNFPPLRSLDNPALRHNLPQQVTSFIGRDKELREVRALMQRTRLLTLTGS